MTISKYIRTVLYLCITIHIFISCSSDDSTNNTEALTEEEAVELIEASLQTRTGGLHQVATMYSENITAAISLNELCNTLQEDTFPYTYEGNLITADRLINLSYNVSCNFFNIPQTAEITATSSGTFTTQRIASNDTSQTSLSVSGLQLLSNTLLFNGNHTREGTSQITINQNTRNINSIFDIEITNLTIDKQTLEIISGNALVTLTGTTNQGNPFSFEGAIVFNDNQTITLIINGNEYEINIS